jgi:integrase
MARNARASRLETRSSRLKLPVAKKPVYVKIDRGIALGYRRNAGAGVWVMRVTRNGEDWTEKIGVADDYEEAAVGRTLTYWTAQARARELAVGAHEAGGRDATRPLTVAEAVAEYATDCAARGAGKENATRITKNLTPALAERVVALLTSRDLSTWRDGLLAAGMKPATMVRLSRATKAALNLASRRDHRIANRKAWTDGLAGVSEDYESRNVQRLDDDQVRAVIAASHTLDPAFGLYAEVAAISGARPSQMSRLLVGDLQDGDAPRLMMPSSRKGRGRKPSRYPVAVSKQLADKLASDRAPDAPLLLRSDGRRWQATDLGDYATLFEKVVAGLGLGVTFYSLRHSSIIRALLGGVPVRVVAATHDTSSEMIERTYSAYIAHYADEIARRGMLDLTPTTNVAPFVRRTLLDLAAPRVDSNVIPIAQR